MTQRIYQDTNILYTPKEQPKLIKQKKKKIWIWIGMVVVLGFLSLLLFKAGFTISEITIEPEENGESIVKKELPQDDPDRINILLMGMRGAADEGDGKLLSDAMVLLSIQKSTGHIGLISMPRDLYVDIYCLNEEHRINFAYAQGGLTCAKNTVSWMTGQYVDYAVISNFKAFESIVDTLGGVDIYLDSTFEESHQWAKEGWPESDYWSIEEFDDGQRWVFRVPTGTNHLVGKEALYFVRSRFSTSDFDRMRHQQQVLSAIKKKILSLGVLTNPVKVYQLLDVIGNNVRVDMSVPKIMELVNIAMEADINNISKIIFDSSEEGFLYETFIGEEYVLLPIGDNWDRIREACQNIIN